MKIAIFENEFTSLENVFKYLNKKFYSNQLEIFNFQRSQNIGDIQNINNYDLVIVDIDLSANSELDGYGLIRKIENEVSPIPNIIILTGLEIDPNYHVVNNLKNKYTYLEKPVNFRKLQSAMDNFLK